MVKNILLQEENMELYFRSEEYFQRAMTLAEAKPGTVHSGASAFAMLLNGIAQEALENLLQHMEQAFPSLTKEECYTFFEDVCTINELLSLSQRFEVARMLTDKRTYLDISEKTGASTATISRVNRSLNYGNDGYEMVFARMEKNKKTEET